MTLPDVNRLFRHWNTTPPLRAAVLAIGGALGVSFKPKPSTPVISTAEEAARFMQATGGRIPGVGNA